MFKVTTKKGSYLFYTLDDATYYIVHSAEKLFDNGAFVKIIFVEDN